VNSEVSNHANNNTESLDPHHAAADQKVRAPTLCIGSITFADDNELVLGESDLVLVVGPNNAGKSELLRAVFGKAAENHTPSPVVESVLFRREGSPQQLESWLSRTGKVVGVVPQRQFRRYGCQVHEASVHHSWSNHSSDIGTLAHAFVAFARTEGRIQESNAPQQIGVQDAASHPLHHVLSDDGLEIRLSDRFKAAFGQELVLNWRAGQQLPLHVGPRPRRSAEGDRVSNEYVEQVSSLPRLDSQGDGMRSFVTLLLYSLALDCPVLLVDEPEAFLHPPQAKLAGELLASDPPHTRQTLIATHSSHVVRGALTLNPGAHVVRLTREGDISRAHIVSPKAVEALWRNPLLRYSNALDGLFHDAVVICEADADCRFYEALFNALARAEKKPAPDLLFTFTSGKARMGELKRALEGAGVRTIAICDFDVLREDKPLCELLDAESWAAASKNIVQIRTALNGKLPSIPRPQVATQIAQIIGSGTADALSNSERDQIKKVLRGTSIWTMAKESGLSILPGGSTSVVAKELLDFLLSRDVAVVPVGELESFCKPASPEHGPAWVEAVLQRDLLHDPDLHIAREFMKGIAKLLRSLHATKRP
jgi:hypothetical protein